MITGKLCGYMAEPRPDLLKAAIHIVRAARSFQAQGVGIVTSMELSSRIRALQPSNGRNELPPRGAFRNAIRGLAENGAIGRSVLRSEHPEHPRRTLVTVLYDITNIPKRPPR